MNVVVVVDDPTIRKLVTSTLEHMGNLITIEDTVAGGKKAAIKGNFMMIILNSDLSDGDGYELCKNIKDNNVKTPVLILSEEQEADVRVKCLRVGAVDFSTIPFKNRRTYCAH